MQKKTQKKNLNIIVVCPVNAVFFLLKILNTSVYKGLVTDCAKARPWHLNF